MARDPGLRATGITNARTEGINWLARQQTKRSACGFRNVANRPPPDTIDLHPHRAGSNNGIKIIATLPSKSR